MGDEQAAIPTRPPAVNVDSEPFWAATAEGRLTLQRCADCGTVVWWPKALCPTCQSFDLGWFDATGRGTVYSYTVVHRAPGSWGRAAPYVLAYVELEEGPRLMTNIVDCDPEAVAIDAAVHVVWHDTGEGNALPRFTLSE
ncbi:MAG: Zn-ribbon domain-containing OB-fold protein [Actinomycetota bacterium]